MYPITHLAPALHWKYGYATFFFSTVAACIKENGFMYLMVWPSSVTSRREWCHWWVADTFLRLAAVESRNESLDWNVAMSGSQW